MNKWKWASDILTGLSGLLTGLMLFTAVIPAKALPYLGIGAWLMMYGATWCEKHLPSTQTQAVTSAVAAGVVEVDGAVVTPPQVVVKDAPAGPTVQP